MPGHAVEGLPNLGFRLPEPLTGRLVGPEDYPEAQALLLAFIANACPHTAGVRQGLAEIGRRYEGAGLRVLAINPQPSDDDAREAPDAVIAEALTQGYVFPYLIDETQRVARSLGVTVTPEFLVFREGRLFYRGRFDPPRRTASLRGRELARAIDRALAGAQPPSQQALAEGTPIAWREAASEAA